MIIKGIDTVEFGVEVPDYFNSLKSTLDILASLKSKAQEETKECETQLNGLSLKVHRNGIPFYAYKLSCNDFLMYFMDKEVKNTSPIKVRFLATYLWSVGFTKAVNDFLNWLTGLGIRITTTKLSRIDICVDSDETPFNKEDMEHVVTKARGKAKHFVNDEYYNGSEFSGFTMGRGDPLLARIYNKTLEVRSSQKFWFFDLWKEKFWKESKPVWRVEFQIRRKCLKEFGINSIDDFILRENNIWSYLTGEWLTLKTPRPDKNKTRWPLDSRWLVVQNADLNQRFSPAIRKKVKVGNTEQLLDQIAGLLISVGTLNNHESLEITAEIARLWTESKLYNRNTTFNEEKKKRSKRFLSNHSS
ncbi:replication initiation factor [Bacillus sp. PK3_68]|uniref:replication initiation factor n=1 Tax=Bacillus sp. PK3_68 TaxID=2027408 RepID=UPI000E71E624|nr:replication initiation factor [Bacillus sp. PK3_68]RJS61756.1 replication initiation factor [Bacillus sp. PK3_68]